MTNEIDNDPGEEFPAELAALKALAKRIDGAVYRGPAWRAPRHRVLTMVFKPLAAMAAAVAAILLMAYLSLMMVHHEPLPVQVRRPAPSPTPAVVASAPVTLDVSLVSSVANAHSQLLQAQTGELSVGGISLEMPSLDSSGIDGFEMVIPTISFSTSFEGNTQ